MDYGMMADNNRQQAQTDEHGVVLPDANRQGVVMTDSASAEIQRVRETKGDNELALRIEVTGGGCAGFQYSFSWESRKANNDDCVYKHPSGVVLVIDSGSLEFLHGSVLDYKTELIGSWFQIRNPQAASQCGCGSSFGLA